MGGQGKVGLGIGVLPIEEWHCSCLFLFLLTMYDSMSKPLGNKLISGKTVS